MDIKTVEIDAQKEYAVTAKVYLGGIIPVVNGYVSRLKIPSNVLEAAGIHPHDELELIATESGILIKKTGKALHHFEPSMKESRLNPVVESLMEDAKFKQRMKNNQLSDEELDQLEKDEASAETEKRKREEEATLYR